jgi:hypothetical protein
VVRMSKGMYERRVMIAMSIYVALLLVVWPLSRDAADVGSKLFFALVPVLPLLYVIWLLAQRILQSDELEQRMHLIGLGVASAVVSVASLICAFLALAKLMTLETAALALMWVFPLMMITYGIVRSYAGRRYGVDGCDEGDAWPYYVRFMSLAVLFCGLAAYARWRAHDDYLTGMACGMACGMLITGGFFWLRRRILKKTPAE